MTSGFGQYIAGYTVANLLRYPIRRRVAFASALECSMTAEKYVTLKQQQWRIPLLKPVDSDETFFDISINIDQICMGFKTDNPRKLKAKDVLYATFCQRSDQKGIGEQPKIFGCSSIAF